MKNITGQKLKDMFISGSNNLYNFYPEIDALNVFPVPDGDTGINMNLTLTSGCKEIANKTDEDVYEIAKAFSHGLLMGARGNSGVITSQIFRGFAEALEGEKELNTFLFSNAIQSGVEVAYKAVVRPVEGTILTVIRESSQALKDAVKANDKLSIDKAFDILLKEARESLKRTPELLPILKEVGVIDSGGAGLIKILEGMKSACEGEMVERNPQVKASGNLPAAGSKIEEEEFGYCTEFIMSLGPDSVKRPFNVKRFTTILSSHGNSLVVVNDKDIVKVHIHTLNPGGILNYAQQFGEFLKIKIENMTEQHHALESGANENSNLDFVGDSDIKQEEKIENALIAVSSGDGIDNLFKEIGVNFIVRGGQTMNPSSQDFAKAIKTVNAKNVFIFPNNSNVVMAASQASEIIDSNECNVYVIPSKSIPQGISAITNFNCDADGEENFEVMRSALKNVKSGEITYATRDTSCNGLNIKKNDFIGIVDGEIVQEDVDLLALTKKVIEQMIDPSSALITILAGESVDDQGLQEIKSYIENNHPDVEIELRKGNQPIYSFLIGVE